MSPGSLDVVVVGGGAAGMSAALVLGRARRRVVVIDAGSPRNAPAARMQGFLSRDGTPPGGLLALGRREVRAYGVDLIVDEVEAISPGFTVRTRGGRTLLARRVLIATGSRDVLPDIDGVHERWGRDLLHCPYCHGWEVRDQPLGVLGTGPDAFRHALLVRQWSDDVVFFSHTTPLDAYDRASLAARGIDTRTGTVARLVIDADRLAGVELVDGSVIPRTAVFIRPVNIPHSDGFAAGLGYAVDAAGFPVVDASGRTSVPGVWAAGNAVDPRLHVISSAGAGSVAAIAINADLVSDDLLRAQHGERGVVAEARCDARSGSPRGPSSRGAVR